MNPQNYDRYAARQRYRIFLPVSMAILCLFANSFLPLTKAQTLPPSGRPTDSEPGGPRYSTPKEGVERGSEKKTPIFKPPTTGIPGRIDGGGTRGPVRGNCLAASNQYPLTLFSPKFTDKSDKTQEVKFGLTLQASPTFYAYIPEVAQPENEKIETVEVVFSLKKYPPQPSINKSGEANPNTSDQSDLIYEKRLQIPVKSGIISLNLPADTQLEVNQLYEWSFLLVCPNSDGDFSGFPTDVGLVQRTTLDDLTQKLTPEISDRDRIMLLSDRGIWFESFSWLVEQRFTNLDDQRIADDWESFLKSVNLDKFSQVEKIPPLPSAD